MINPSFLLVTFAGLVFGLGVVLLVLALRGQSTGVRPPRALQLGHWSRERRIRWGVAVAGGLLTLLITRWITVALAIAVIAVMWPRLFGGARSQARQIRKLEALASWVESLRDTISTGQALPEALPASALTAAPEIAEPLSNLLDRMRARQSLDQALLLLADDLDDPEADSVIGALAMNARVQGKRLNVVLTSLAESARKQLTIRREVEAGRASMRRGVTFVIITTCALVIGMTVFNRDYVEPYSTVTGQIVLAIVIGLFTAGLFWLRRLADFETRRRFLVTPQTTSQATASPWQSGHLGEAADVSSVNDINVGDAVDVATFVDTPLTLTTAGVTSASSSAPSSPVSTSNSEETR